MYPYRDYPSTPGGEGDERAPFVATVSEIEAKITSAAQHLCEAASVGGLFILNRDLQASPELWHNV
jgi:hypothetical protein